MYRSVFVVFLVLALYPPAAHPQPLPDEQDRRTALRHYQSGQAYLRAEQWQKAAGEFETAIKLDRLFTDAHYGLGRANMSLEEYPAAIRAFRGCIEASRTLHGMRESDRVSTDKRIDDEIRALREAIRAAAQNAAQPGNVTLKLEARIRDLERNKSSLGGPFQPPAEVLLSLGSAYYRNQDVAAAEAQWEEAVKVNPKLGEAWNNLAVVYMRTDRKKEAEDAVKKAERNGFHVHPRLKDDIRAMKSEGP